MKNLTLDWTSNCVAENGVTISVNGVDQPETEIEQIDVAKTVVTVEPCVPLEIIVKIKLKTTQGRPYYMIIFIVLFYFYSVALAGAKPIMKNQMSLSAEDLKNRSEIFSQKFTYSKETVEICLVL